MTYLLFAFLGTYTWMAVFDVLDAVREWRMR